MRTAIGLIGLGLVGGVVPAGLAAIQYAAVVLACTFGALLLLLACCVVASSIGRPTTPATPAPQMALRRAASTGSAPRSI